MSTVLAGTTVILGVPVTQLGDDGGLLLQGWPDRTTTSEVITRYLHSLGAVVPTREELQGDPLQRRFAAVTDRCGRCDELLRVVCSACWEIGDRPWAVKVLDRQESGAFPVTLWTP